MTEIESIKFERWSNEDLKRKRKEVPLIRFSSSTVIEGKFGEEKIIFIWKKLNRKKLFSNLLWSRWKSRRNGAGNELREKATQRHSSSFFPSRIKRKRVDVEGRNRKSDEKKRFAVKLSRKLIVVSNSIRLDRHLFLFVWDNGVALNRRVDSLPTKVRRCSIRTNRTDHLEKSRRTWAVCLFFFSRWNRWNPWDFVLAEGEVRRSPTVLDRCFVSMNTYLVLELCDASGLFGWKKIKENRDRHQNGWIDFSFFCFVGGKWKFL